MVFRMGDENMKSCATGHLYTQDMSNVYNVRRAAVILEKIKSLQKQFRAFALKKDSKLWVKKFLKNEEER